MKKLLNVYSSLKKDRSLFSLSFLIEFAWNLLLIELLDRLMAYSAQSDICLFSKTSVLFCTGAVIFVLLVFSDQYFFRKLKGVGELKLQEYTYGCFLKNLSSVQCQKAGDLVSAVNRNTEVISQWMSTGVVNTILQTFLLLAYLLILLLHNAVVTMITVFIIIVIFLLSKLYAQKEAAYTAEKQTRYSEINSKLLDTLNNRNLIYALNNEAFFSNKLKTFHDQISQSVLVPLSRYTALRNAMLTFMINTLPVIVLVSTILLAKLGKATGSDAITMMPLLRLRHLQGYRLEPDVRRSGFCRNCSVCAARLHLCCDPDLSSPVPAHGQSLPWRHLLRRSCSCQRVGHLRDSRAHPRNTVRWHCSGLRTDRDRLCSYHSMRCTAEEK